MDATSPTCHFAPVFPYRPDLKNKRPQVPQGPVNFPGLAKNWLVEFESCLSSDRKVQLFSHLYRAEPPSSNNAHRALFVLHGQGEQGARYSHWPHYLKDQVDSIYAIDHRGHGQSSGIRGHVDHFDLYADDAAAAFRRYRTYLLQRYGQAEIHLLGHSMGGLIALRMLLLHDLPIQSVILSAPMIELAFAVGRLKLLLGKALARVLPYLPLPAEPMADLVSRDPFVVKHYKQDPLNHTCASPAFYFSYLEAKNDTISRAKDMTQPLLVLLPLADRIINPEATKALFAQLGSVDKTLLSYPGLYHEVFNEPEKDNV
ncbi:MAG: lysophospholipase, partial [Proteobacteria bacterium]|nr:lysophospholipase [Pseudomonadota bacterium]